VNRFVALVAVSLAFAVGASMAQAQQRNASPDRERVRQACAADIQRLCAGVQPGGGQLVRCIREHRSELSPACQEALAAARAARSTQSR
jgi:hypothetical protein